MLRRMGALQLMLLMQWDPIIQSKIVYQPLYYFIEEVTVLICTSETSNMQNLYHQADRVQTWELQLFEVLFVYSPKT